MMAILLFWACCISGAAGLPFLLYRVRRREWAWAAFTVFLVANSATNAIFWWRAAGPCLLPHPSIIEYRRGMTSCPGQATTIPIEIPASDQLDRIAFSRLARPLGAAAAPTLG